MEELQEQLRELARRVTILERRQDHDEIMSALHALSAQLSQMETKVMATLDAILQDVTDESTAIDGISTLISGLKQQLADALAGITLPPATQAKVDAIFAQAETNKGKIATALAANTPAAPAV